MLISLTVEVEPVFVDVTASISMAAVANIAAVSSTMEQGCCSRLDWNCTSSRSSCSLSRSCYSGKNSPGKDAVYGTRKSELRKSSSIDSIFICCVVPKNGVEAASSRRGKPKPKKNLPGEFFNKLQFPSSLVPLAIRSLFFMNPSTNNKNDVEVEEVKEDSDMDIEEQMNRVDWIERVIELQNQWRQEQQLEKGHGGSQLEEVDLGENGGAEDGCCEVEYEDEDEEIDQEKFSRFLRPVSLAETKLLSKLAFLSNRAYAIPNIKAEDLKIFYGLDLVTSSIEKKAEAAAIKDKLDQDSITWTREQSSDNVKSGADQMEQSEQKHLPHLISAYWVAAAAASYVHSRAKDLLSFGSEPHQGSDDDAVRAAKSQNQEQEETRPELNDPGRAAYVAAASTMTAVVAACEKQKQEVAKELQSLQSSPCEWFVCDEPGTYTRCFIIQGSNSRASWQTNLLFDPIKFEETDALVHRGMYEAAKGIYEQFMPEIRQHLERYGNQAKLQFAGHSLGGSLSLLVHLMLLTRGAVEPSTILPTVTFGSPFVFCGGQRVLEQLGLKEDDVYSVMIHRDIVPRSFSCNYSGHLVQTLKRLNGNFRSHPCLNSKNKMLYSPMGKVFILQPDENSSPGHPFLPPGTGIYSLENTHCPATANALRAFLNNPHPLETLSDLTAYGSQGKISRDHHSCNYLKAVHMVIMEEAMQALKKAREERNQILSLFTSESPHQQSHERNFKGIRET